MDTLLSLFAILAFLAAGLAALILRQRLRVQRIHFQQAQKLLEESRERLQLALDGADEALWDWNVKQHCTYYSDRYSQMLGFSPQEIGDSVQIFEDLVHPEDLAIAMKKLDAHMTGLTGSYQAEFRMKTKQGGWRWIQSRGKIVARAADGSPARVAGTHIDITEQKRLAAELAEARDAALAASRAKSSFLANMSHEIRTPMNGIVGIAELLLETARDDQQREYAGIVRSSSEALLVILNDILDFSKIEAGQMTMESRPFDLREVVRQAPDLFSLAAEQKGLRLDVNIDSGLPARVWGDAGRLRQILVNLIGNAVKFTERGGVSVRCRRIPCDSERIAVELEVNDTGSGMTPAVVDTLFRPFTQADGSTTRRYGGTGLGLAICKLLAGLMHGDISVTSVPGKGSAFRVTVALEPAPAGPAAEADRDDRTPHPAAQSAHILLAEDNAINQRVMTHMLARLGHSVEIVANGREAVEAASRGGYDAILMDCQMPEMSGWDATRAIRRRESSGDRLPIIALTANAMPADRDLCIEAGMDDYLSKPVKLETLARTLDEWLADGATVRNPAP